MSDFLRLISSDVLLVGVCSSCFFFLVVSTCWQAPQQVPSSVILPSSAAALTSLLLLMRLLDFDIILAASTFIPDGTLSFTSFFAERLTTWSGTACRNLVDSILYWWTLCDSSYPTILRICLFRAKRVTLTFSVAKLVQAAFCKYQVPYCLNFFKNFLPSAYSQ